MKSGATSHSPQGTSQAGSSSTPQRRVDPRTVLVVTAVILGPVVVLVAMFESGALRRPMHEDAEPSREISSRLAPSPAERKPVPRPALPQAQPAPAEPAPAEPRSVGVGAAEAQRKLTQSKVQKYVHQAYPAWLRAHPGEECPHRLIELNEYMEDKNAKDAWGRPLRMFCGAARWAGAKRIEVISLGRDAEAGTEDDIKAEE
jgi:hypothetical protein